MQSLHVASDYARLLQSIIRSGAGVAVLDSNAAERVK